MEASEQVNLFQDFFERHKYAEIIELVRKGQSFIKIDFAELGKFNPELAESLLETPEEAIRAGEIAIERFDLEADVSKFKVRFFNLPDSQKIKISEIRSVHLGKFLVVEGIVRRKTDVRPQVTSAKFECPSCGNIIRVLQLDSKFKEPRLCGACGRKGKFILLSKELVDAQQITIEESPEELEGGEQPKRLNIFLKDDLVSPFSEKKTSPGSRVSITLVIKETPIVLNSGAISTRFELIGEANFVEAVQEEFTQLEISKEEIEQIKELSRDKEIYAKLVNSIAPSIFGHTLVKEALVLQLFGGVKKRKKDGANIRGDMHILLVGDPGSGKSQMLKRVSFVAPKARYVSGKGATGTGLTATVVKDDFLRGWALEAGMLVLANRGICCIDELDKMTKEDTSAMHEALEQQTVTIAKANINATLRCETTVLAAANPKFGRFDPYELIAKQIDLPSTLVNRFDLIFPVRDIPDLVKDDQTATFILNLHQDENEIPPEIDTSMLKKYIAYAKQNIFPKLSDVAKAEINQFYVKLRNKSKDDGGIKSVPISPRQLEALVRLSEASARTRFSTVVQKKDARRAIDLLYHCLSEIGIDPATGELDVDRIVTGVTSSQRSSIHKIKSLLKNLEEHFGKQIPIDVLTREAGNEGLSEEQVEEFLEKLRLSGDVFFPKSGFVGRT
ncbi:MAG: minichromosome maintenance protein MCM [Candidatus Woesearchaeota archaeon]